MPSSHETFALQLACVHRLAEYGGRGLDNDERESLAAVLARLDALEGACKAVAKAAAESPSEEQLGERVSELLPQINAALT